MVIEAIRENLYQVKWTKTEVEWIYEFVPRMSDYGIEIHEGINILEKDTLWFILSELNGVQYHATITSEIVNQLKSLLYPTE